MSAKGKWILDVPPVVVKEADGYASKHGWTRIEAFRRILTLGMTAIAIIGSEDKQLIVRGKDGDRRVTL